jgi:hypothetical protein
MSAGNRPEMFHEMGLSLTLSFPSCGNPSQNTAKIIPPCAKGQFPGITVPSGRITAVAAAGKAKEEPGNTGTLNLVQQWNIKVPTLKENSAGHGMKLISKGMHGSAEYREQVLDAERIIPGCQFFVVTHYSTPFLFIFRPILSKKGVKGNYFSYFVSGVYFISAKSPRL